MHFINKLPLLLAVFFITSLQGQLNSGFESDEAIELIRICNSQTFKDIYGSDKEIIPSNLKRIYSSTPNVMDNMFQVYEKKGKTGIIHFRGSTSHPNSWIENMYSAMIPATGEMTIYGEKKKYSFAKNEDAGIHSGFALGTMLMVEDVISQIKLLNSRKIYDIIITGHSQGGALAISTHAYLENLPKGKLDKRNTYKMYAFANPMIGNSAFASEYNKRFTEEGMAFRIINPKDIIPSMPLTYHDGKIITSENIYSWLTGAEEFNYKKLGIELIMKKFNKGITAYIVKSNQTIEKLISRQAGKIELPEYLNDIQYASVGELHKVGPFEYPEIIKDSSAVAKEEFSNFERMENGRYKREEPTFYQHKPYNYYVGILKKYAVNEYRKLDNKYLKENL